MSQTLRSEPFSQADHSQRLGSNVPCRRCGYNLRGLVAHARCPECGLAVGLSVSGNLLRFCDPTWVRTLHRGTRLILGGVAALVLGTVLAVAVMMALQRNLVLLLAVVQFIAYGMVLAGTWLLTEPDPSGLGEHDYGTSRKIIRVGLIMAAGAAVIGIAADLAAEPLKTMLMALGVVLKLGMIVGFVAQLVYLSRLCHRIPDLRLASRAQFLAWTIGGTYAVMLAGSVLTVALFPDSAGGSALCLMGLAGLALLILMLMYISLLAHVGRHLNFEAGVAEQTWAHAPPAPGVAY